ncbi:hypothetical protein P3H78_10745 [Streptomyces sp. K1PA1]|uniref:Restriction endonuclease n=1 Tax=Streptomyces tropicalis TaxID=3034234 RepID=A0ABT6A5L0_9ACTN|nr:hypothetical protein [Streptomyces tropicalis]
MLRAQGRYGPEFREVLPALAGCALVFCLAVAGTATAWRSLGPGVPLVGLGCLVLGIAAAVRRRRPLARRRHGYYTAEELSGLDTPGLALAVARMLRRDGWRVLPAPEEPVRPRVRARRGRDLPLEVVFRPVAEPLPDEDAPGGTGGTGRALHLVVHRGAFSPRDVQWARRDGGTRLLDGALLHRWALGTPLHRLVDLS